MRAPGDGVHRRAGTENARATGRVTLDPPRSTGQASDPEQAAQKYGEVVSDSPRMPARTALGMAGFEARIGGWPPDFRSGGEQ